MMKRFLQGFVYAAKGIKAAVRSERNLRFHLCAAAYVLLFSIFYPFGRVEYALLFLCIGGVIALELVNSALERAVERPSPDKWLLAGQAKDMAAGAVLVFSLGCVGVGVCLFWQPQPFFDMLRWFAARPPAIGALALSIVGAVAFVFYPSKKG